MSPEAEKQDPEQKKKELEEKVRGEVCTRLNLKPESLDEMKKMVGKISVIPIGGDLFIYRSIKRIEMKELKAQVAKAGGDESLFEEKLAARGLVHPKLSEDELRNGDGGLASTLADAILTFSGFEPDAAPVKL